VPAGILVGATEQAPSAKPAGAAKSAAVTSAAEPEAATATARTAAKRTAAKRTAAKPAAAKAPAAEPAAVAEPSAKPAPAKEPARKRASAVKPETAATAPTKTAPAKAAPAKRAPAAKKATQPRPTAAQSPPPPSEAAVQPAEAAPPGLLPVKEGEEPWTEQEIAEVRAELDRERALLVEELADTDAVLAETVRGGDGSGDDQADAGTRTFELEQGISLAANTARMLAQVDRALRRLDAGGYGICENCGEPIGKLRLQTFPRATLCLRCKQLEERR